MSDNDRYGIANVVNIGDGGVDLTEENHTEFIKQLLADEFNQTTAMHGRYPERYNNRVADKNARLYETTSYQLLEQVEGTAQVTSKGARILVKSGLALAMSRAYHCARAELSYNRGDDPIDVRDTFESAQRMVAHWLPALLDLDPDLVPVEIYTNTRMDGSEERDLSVVKERIRSSTNKQIKSGANPR